MGIKRNVLQTLPSHDVMSYRRPPFWLTAALRCAAVAVPTLALGAMIKLETPYDLQQARRTIRAPYLEPEIPLGGRRGIGSTSKVGMMLDILEGERSVTRGPNQTVVRLGTREQERMGIDPESPDPIVTATVELTPKASVGAIRQSQLSVLTRIGRFVTVRGPMSNLVALARDSSIRRVDLVARSRLTMPRMRDGASKDLGSTVPTIRAYTGKGVAIAVIDSGIDWTHADFIKRDGSTRILAIYDTEDQSWRTSRGKIGCKPPLSDDDGPVGTVYTSDQINLALRGKLKLGTRDKFGHGTAVAGIACGNGFSAGSSFERYRGVAPDASLIVIRAGDEAMTELWAPFAQWALSVSKAHRMPLVVNISAGTQYTAHDGTLAEESELDQLAQTEDKGFAVVAAAGNEGEDQIVATGRFSSRIAGLTSFEGKDIEVTSRPAEADCVPPLVCYFSGQDDWGLMVEANQAPYVDGGGNGLTMEITKSQGKPMVAYASKDEIDPRLKERIARSLVLTQTESGDDSLMLPLPAGTYTVTAFGSGPSVRNGRFMFSLPAGESSFFSMGATSRYTISSPGNAASVVTVGSYNYRNALQSKAGAYRINTELGALADYSSRGFRRDGWVKPDLAGPGSLQVSSLAAGSDLQRDAVAEGGYEIAATGKHFIWQGTSAAAPYVAGVIALMLQKNPTLGAGQIRTLLTRSAKIDKFTGAAPNPDWGFGKLDPERAIAMTPAGRRRR